MPIVFVAIICLLTPSLNYAEPGTSVFSDKNLEQITRLADDLIAYYKSAYVEQGGGGPFQAFVGNVAAWFSLNNTVNIREYSRVKRDTAMAFAKQLAGDRNELIGLHLKNKLESIPDLNYSSDRAGTALAETIIATYAEERKAGVMTQEETQAVYNMIAERFRKIQPHTAMDMNGNIIEPQINRLSKVFFGSQAQESRGPSSVPGLST